MIDVSNLLEKSYKILIKYKFLWLFGFFLALGGTGSSSFNYNFNSSSNPHIIDSIQKYFEKFSSLSIAIIIALIFILLILGLVILILRYISEAAIISCVNDIEENKEVSLHTGFSSGFKNGLKFFGIDLLIGIFVSIVVMILFLIAMFLLLLLLGPGIILIIKKQLVIGIILTIIGGIISLDILISVFISLLAVIIFSTVIGYFSKRYIVIKSKKFIEGIKDSYGLFKHEVKSSLLIWLLLIPVSLFGGFVCLLIAGVFAIPVGLLFFVNVYAAIIAAVPVILLYIFLLGILQVYIQTFITLGFREITSSESV